MNKNSKVVGSLEGVDGNAIALMENMETSPQAYQNVSEQEAQAIIANANVKILLRVSCSEDNPN